jgi:uncharacterized YccA/Bax inhibitor family protein
MSFKPNLAPYLAPAYAIIEGLFLGAISALYEFGFGAGGGYSGIVFQAIGLTICVAGSMYALYHFKIISATKKFRAVITVATVGLGIFYLGLYLLTLFMGNSIVPGFLTENTMLGIGFSLFVVALAALNLILDFDNIEKAAQSNQPKYMEWFCGFGLLVTIVWLYLEILRLLAKLKD